jgi:hypothetical protein
MSRDPAGWERVKRLFQSALERPVAERTRFVEDACGSDRAVLSEVQSLLAAHPQAGEFAEHPPVERFGGVRTVAQDLCLSTDEGLPSDPNATRRDQDP